MEFFLVVGSIFKTSHVYSCFTNEIKKTKCRNKQDDDIDAVEENYHKQKQQLK